jgi:heme exporter protein A
MAAPPLFPPLRLVGSGLAVIRGERLLFEGLDLAVASGQALLLRGPNGAGKSSLLAVLAGLSRPERGSVFLDGLDPEARMGTALHLVGHASGVKPRLTLAENLAFWAALNGAGESVADALMTVGLGALGWLEAGNLSAGQTRRLALARLLVSRRPLWLLDEPTASLDAEGEALVGALLSGHLAHGGLAVVATHQALALPAGAPCETLLLGGGR